MTSKAIRNSIQGIR